MNHFTAVLGQKTKLKIICSDILKEKTTTTTTTKNATKTTSKQTKRNPKKETLQIQWNLNARKSHRTEKLCRSSSANGDLKIDEGDSNENVNKAIGLMSKTTTLHVQHIFFADSFDVTARIKSENA